MTRSDNEITNFAFFFFFFEIPVFIMQYLLTTILSLYFIQSFNFHLLRMLIFFTWHLLPLRSSLVVTWSAKIIQLLTFVGIMPFRFAWEVMFFPIASSSRVSRNTYVSCTLLYNDSILPFYTVISREELECFSTRQLTFAKVSTTR